MFYIIDAGRRISTPIDHLLAPLRVGATAAVRPVAQSDGARPPAIAAYSQAARAHAEADQRPRRLQVASELMSPVRCAAMTETVAEAWAILLRERFHHLPIVDITGELRGIISDRDLLRAAASHSHEETSEWTLERLMQRRVIAAGPSAPLRELAEVMTQRRIGAVPVVDDRNRPVGIVTRADLLRAIVHQAPLELWG